MHLADRPMYDARQQITAVHHDLIALLDELGDDEWTAPTEAGSWRVKDVVLHLLDDDLGRLSRDRDGDTSGWLTVHDHRSLVAALDAKNEQWVAATGSLSRRVVVDLLRWAGEQVHAHLEAVDLDGPTSVAWASSDPVPRWFDLCRDLTERWVHQQHVRDAVGRPGDHARFLPDVLRTFVWAFPHQYRPAAPSGTTVQIDLDAGGTWHLVRAAERWLLEEGPAAAPSAEIRMPASVGWRQLTGLPVDMGAVHVIGPSELVGPLLAVRGIIV